MELDDAYANAAYIPGADAYPDKWAAAAAAFRTETLCETELVYGESPRQRLDLFHPARLAKGLVVFVHGGYWLRFDKSFWSHLAAGPLAHGWAVAMPSYDLCPDVRITEIGNQVAAAIALAADRVPGPVRLTGHSAGGQLVARMTVRRFGARWQDRLEKVVPISPVADLAPLMRTSMNADLKLDAAEAQAESPIHLPTRRVPVTVWVGAEERPVFLEQAMGLATAWQCDHMVERAHHHFSVVEGLANPESALTHAVVG
ncbi:alpha/beta hydrolase [Yoonia sp. F2084L]|uniref:alpha/beta hydrolase n=1 Tax=Yoonia sp. F2084L TaxID=2926419 RepID=UPI001FF422E9|nr:alpha/beta hydrolase [Yoonia sp. F2084L]MCK0096604.1 alpha/beta hydrolase [Yoonia sp. F2084L]